MCLQLRSKKDFLYEEKVKGQWVNVVAGLELHRQVLNEAEQALMVKQIEGWEARGRAVRLPCSFPKLIIPKNNPL